MIHYAVADLDLQIKGRGGGGGGGQSQKNSFSALQALVWSKTKGEARAPRAPNLDPPLLIVEACILP